MSRQELINKARKEGLWIHAHDIWFHPDELEELNARGRFNWGVVNFKLADPSERTRQLELAVTLAQNELQSWKEKLSGKRNG